MRRKQAKILLGVRVDPEVKRELFDRAAALGTSPSTLIRGMVETILKSDDGGAEVSETTGAAIPA